MPTTGSKPLFLVPHDFEDRRFFVGETTIPYDFSGAKLRDEILKRTDAMDVVLAADQAETMMLAPRADFMAVDKMSRALFDAATKCRWVHMASSGADHFFKRSGATADEFRQRGIMLTTSKGAGQVVIAEQVLCYMLMFSRRMVRAVRQHLVGHWERYPGQELCGLTLGVIGLGAIGARVAYLGKALGMRVIACKQNPDKGAEHVDEVYPADDFRKVMAKSDFVLLAVPINRRTENIINRETLSVMKPTAFMMNVARGECIDEDAVVWALNEGIIAGYASDNHGRPSGPVTDANMERLEKTSKLWGRPDVIVSPNCAVAGPRRYEYMAGIVADNYAAISAGKEPKTRLIWEGKPV